MPTGKASGHFEFTECIYTFLLYTYKINMCGYNEMFKNSLRVNSMKIETDICTYRIERHFIFFHIIEVKSTKTYLYVKAR